MTYMEYLQSVQNYFYMSCIPVLLICGTAGNILSFCVYVRKWSAFTIPLFFLSCADLLFLWSESILKACWAYLGVALEATTIGCKLSVYMFTVTFYSSTCTIALFTIMRVYSVVRALHFKSVFTTKRTLHITSTIFVLTFALNSHAFIGLDTVSSINGTLLYSAMACDFSDSYVEIYMQVWLLLDVVVSVACLGTILIGNGIIIISLVRHAHGNTQSGINTRDISQRLIAITAVYFLTYGPSIAYSLFVYGQKREVGSSEDWWKMMMLDVAIFPLWVQSAFGFTLYVLLGKEMRDEVKRIIFCYRRENNRRAIVAERNETKL